jgi:hydrogenase maturation protein HypF
MPELSGAQIHISGIVQGVGFRPFVYGLAFQHQLYGWVKNTSAGVEIQVDGTPESIQAFIHDLQTKTPPLAHIDTLTSQLIPPDGFSQFIILDSQTIAGAFQPISPDVCICPDCLAELFDPADRRHHYPFINCTNCGPRFTIIADIPYDRPYTTMAEFPLCPDCAAEYTNPLDRRFHAQPVACPVCGPQVWLEVFNHPEHSLESFTDPQPKGEEALRVVQDLLKAGKILAIKGLGGFHLACDAENPAAVTELRRRKLRVDKPFALMLADTELVKEHCHMEAAEQELLESPARPIVILKRKPGSTISVDVSPGQDTLGVMLPYTPLHYLLFASIRGSDPAKALVMTSGNLSEEPIVSDNEMARQRLNLLADAALMHNRSIYIRCDDSVLRVSPSTGENIPLRRSRGYAPYPVKLPWEAPALLATGAELKNTFCLTQANYAFLSQHIGDLENYETLDSFEESVRHYERIFRVKPALLAYDLHPDYLASRYALERAAREGLPAIGIQHHHAHIAAVMTEHTLPAEARVIGVAFDGTGYGSDGAIWGGEFLLAGYTAFQRLAHLAYFPLPGGDAAIRKSARTALAALWQAGLTWDDHLGCVQACTEDELMAIRNMLVKRVNSPLTSSMGRLFDAVAALANIRQQVNYEAQAAIELEALVDPHETGFYPFHLTPPPDRPDTPPARSIENPWMLNVDDLLKAVVDDVYAQIPVSTIAARFHNSIANLVLHTCQVLAQETGIQIIALSGGVWQNMTLLTLSTRLLKQAGFQVLVHRLVPSNDGGLALGQAAIACATIFANPGLLATH